MKGKINEEILQYPNEVKIRRKRERERVKTENTARGNTRTRTESTREPSWSWIAPTEAKFEREQWSFRERIAGV